MVMVQKWPFFQLFFQAIKTWKMSFTIFQNEIMPLQAIKTRSSKSRKIDIFLKRLTHGFGSKITIFPTFFFRQYRLGKWGNSWFWYKNGHFSNFFFQAIQTRKMSFTTFYNEKMPLQAIKTKSSKSRRIDIFLKRLTHGFGSKITIFPTFFLGNIDQENVFYDFLEQKIPLQAIKTRSLKSLKIDSFPKLLTHGFGPKRAVFPTFFFRQYRPGKCLLRYCTTINVFLGYKKKKIKKSKKSHFLKWLSHGFGPKVAIFQIFFFWERRPGKRPLRYSRTKECLSRLQKQEVQKVEKGTFF